MTGKDIFYYSRLTWARIRHTLKLPALCQCSECDNRWLSARHAKMVRYVCCPECREDEIEVQPWDIVLKVPRY